MTEPTAQPANGQQAITPLTEDVRNIVSELLDERDRRAVAQRSFLDDIEKYQVVARTVSNTVALPEWIRGEKVDGQWRGRPPAEQEKIALSVIFAGSELGLPPMVSLRHIFLVEGKIGLSAEIMLKLIIDAGVKFRWVTTTAEKATLWLHRRGHDPHEHTFTAEEAKTAGLINEKRVNWNKYRPAMLRARAISAAARAYCPDITNGCYTREEMEDLAAALAPAPPTSLDQIAAMGAPAPLEQPPAVKIIARFKAATTQDEYKLVVADANYLAHEMDDAEKQAVKLAMDAAAKRLREAAPANG